jgi:hypothetical protein
MITIPQSAITVIVLHPGVKSVLFWKVESGKIEYGVRGYLRHASSLSTT